MVKVRALHTDIEKVGSMKIFDMLPRPIRNKINNADVPFPYDEYLALYRMLRFESTIYEMDSYVTMIISIQAQIIRENIRKDLAKLHTPL